MNTDKINHRFARPLGLLVALVAIVAPLSGCMQDTGTGSDANTGGSDTTDEPTVTKYLYKDQAEAAHIQTLVNGGFADEHPEAAAYLTKFQISGEDESNLMLKVAEAQDDQRNIEQSLAEEYLAANQDLVATWLEGTGADPSVGEGRTIIIGMPNGWTGEMIRSYMVQEILADEFGYDAQIKSLDAGVIYQGLATGDVDVFVGAWLPLQSAHMDKVRDDVEVLGDNVPSDAVTLALAVPQYLIDQGIRSLADLDANKELFGGKIHGIEPGAGMMITGKERTAQWDIYGLSDWTIVDSSTPAMLAAYDSAVQDEEPIVIMIWRPHYAYAKWSGDQAVVDLEDPGWAVPESKLE